MIKQWENLKKAFERGKLSQAYFFSGPRGTGKLDVALRFVGLINGIGEDQKEKLLRGENPDVFIVRPLVEKVKDKIKEKNISIDQIKETIEQFQFYAYQSAHRCLVVDRAQRMTPSAANSLLKLLEEPPKDLVIILIADNEEKVLSTILSRCQRIRFGLISDQKLEQHLREKYFLDLEVIMEKFEQKFLQENELDKNSLIKMMVQLSHGRIEKAQGFLSDPSGFEKALGEINQFKSAFKKGLVNSFDLAEQESRDKQQLILKTENWLWYFRNFLFQTVRNKMDWRIQKKVFIIISALLELRIKLEKTNASEKIQLENFFVQLSD